MPQYRCSYCKTSFFLERTDRGKFCSSECSQNFRKGKITSGSEKGWFKKGEENHNWKGDKAGYKAVHTWVAYYKGRPHKCELCGITKAKQFDWANISHEYKRELNDWIRLCPKCHANYDKKSKKEKKHKW